jgi:ubiquitin carboxyl-terminal hydrolase 2/21
LSPHGSLRGSAASGRSSPSTPKSGRGLCSRGAAGDAASASERAVALASSASAQSLVDSVASGEGLRKSASTASLKKAEFPVPSRRTDGALRGLVGLRNLGNTCFMNSCLQALCSTPELIHFFESGSYRRDLNLCSTTRGRLAEAFGALISAMRRGEPHSVQVPLDVKNTVSIIAPRFSGFGQQDVQEFLQFLLDGLHDDLNRVQRKPKYEEIKDVAHEDDETKSQRWWKNYTDRNDSFVSQLFAGQLKSEVQCAACKHTSTAFDPFWDVSLPIPKRAQGGDSFYSSAPACSLLDCFVEFTRAEHLRGNEQVYCRSCKTHRDAIKVLSVYRYPHILVVTLKRFAAGAESRFSFSRQKLNTLVTFPVAGLDLSAFSPHTRHVPDAKGLVVYDLFAVANHSGSLGGGHYTAYARVAEDRWCCFNDSHCSEIDERTLQGSAAYVLFYRRR